LPDGPLQISSKVSSNFMICCLQLQNHDTAAHSTSFCMSVCRWVHVSFRDGKRGNHWRHDNGIIPV